MLLTSALWLAFGGQPIEPEIVPPDPPAADYVLDWEAPASCPDASTIEARVAALTAGQEHGEGTLEIVGRVQEQGAGFVLTLTTTLRETSGERQLQSTRCAELAETVALVVAVSLDPTVSGSAPRKDETEESEAGVPDPSEEAQAEEPQEVRPSRTTSSTPERSERRRPARRWNRPGPILRAGVGPEWGALPGITAGLRLAIGMGWPSLRVMVVGSYLTPRRDEGPPPSAALHQQGMVGVLGCGVPRVGAWAWPLCAGIEAGGVRIDGRGLQQPRTFVGPWLGPVASAGVVRRVGRVGLWLDVEGVVRGVATQVFISESLIFRPRAGSLRALAGVEISWP
ncbi:MAG: hypothetical protein AAF799_06740 [Myxococcota bacterium]